MNGRNIWVVYFIGFDENTTGGETIEPSVGFERIESTEDPQQQHDDAVAASVMRGGQLLAIVDEDNEKKAAELADAFSRDILRMR